MIFTHKIKMDLSRRGISPVVHMVQGDSNTRALEISLYDNGQPWEIPGGVTAAVAFSKADGTRGLYDKLPDKSNATTIAGSVVTAILAPEVLTCAGQVRVAIVLYDAEMDTLATFTIMVVVEANPAAGKQISNNYYYLQNMEQVNAAYADILTRLDELKIEAGTEVPANAAEMKTLTIGGETFEIVDEQARANKIDKNGVNQVTRQNADFIENVVSRNLFNKDAEGVVQNVFVNYGNGELVNGAGRFASDYIPVDVGGTYAFIADYGFSGGGCICVACYASDKTYAGYLEGSVIDNSDSAAYKIRVIVNQGSYKHMGTGRTVNDVAFVRVFYSLSAIGSYMFIAGSEYPDEYEAFGASGNTLAEDITVPGVAANTKAVAALAATVATYDARIENKIDKNGVNQVTRQNAEFIKNFVSCNLFDKDAEGISNGYIVPGGAFYANDNWFTSDYIAVEPGKRYTTVNNFAFYGAVSGSAVCCYNADKEFIGCIIGDVVDDTVQTEVVITFTMTDDKRSADNWVVGNEASDICFIRTSQTRTIIDKYMVADGDTYPDEYEAFGASSDTLDEGITVPGLDELKKEVEDISGGLAGSVLCAKTIIWNGDSICAGKAFDDNADAWAGRIAERNGMTYKNYAQGGGTLTENVKDNSGNTKHSVSATLATMYAEYPDADYIVLEGGTNDADLLGSHLNGATPEKFGSFNVSDFSGNYDKNTFCGALESIFFRATNYWKGKKIGFIVAQKMGRSTVGYTAETHNRRNYFETVLAICKKWGIPVLNLWDDCYLNPTLPHHFTNGATWETNKAAGNLYADGQHLLSAGYDFTASTVEAWLKTL